MRNILNIVKSKEFGYGLGILLQALVIVIMGWGFITIIALIAD